MNAAGWKEALRDGLRRWGRGAGEALLAGIAVAVVVTWPLAAHAFSDTGFIVTQLGPGSELIGNLTSQSRTFVCLAGHGAAPWDAVLHPVRLLLVASRCDFETGLWNTVDAAFVFMPARSLVGPGPHWNLGVLVIVAANAAGGWVLGRVVGGGSRLAAFVAAGILALNGATWMAFLQGRVVQAAIFPVPLVLAGCVQLLRGRGGVGVALGTALALAVALHWYWFLALFLAVLAPALLPFAGELRRHPGRLGWFVLAGLVAAAIVAPAVPWYRAFADHGGLVEFAPSVGGTQLGLPAPGTPGMAWDQRATLDDSLPVPAILYPWAWWNPIHPINPAWTPQTWLLLAAVGLFAGREAIGWLVGTALGLLLTFGPWPLWSLHGVRTPGDGGPWPDPVYHWLYAHVPLFPAFRHPDRFLVAWTVGVGALAALGARVLAGAPEGPVRRGGLRRLGIGLVAGALLLGAPSMAATRYWPLRMTPFHVPPELVAEVGVPGSAMHLPVLGDAARRWLGDAAGGPGFPGRARAMSVFHGRPLWDPVTVLPTPGWLPDLVRSVQTGDLGAAAGLRDALVAAGVTLVLVDEGGFRAVSREAGSDRFDAVVAALTTVLGAAPVAFTVDNSSFLPFVEAPGAPAPAYRMVAFHLPGPG